jgi:CHAT domain
MGWFVDWCGFPATEGVACLVRLTQAEMMARMAKPPLVWSVLFSRQERGILVSNCAVETVSARLLTTTLFRKQAADPQMTRAEALRQSMLELTRTSGQGYGHPAFWAAFSLVGDGGN